MHPVNTKRATALFPKEWRIEGGQGSLMLSPPKAGVSSWESLRCHRKSGQISSVQSRNRGHTNFVGEKGRKLHSGQNPNGAGVCLQGPCLHPSLGLSGKPDQRPRFPQSKPSAGSAYCVFPGRGSHGKVKTSLHSHAGVSGCLALVRAGV